MSKEEAVAMLRELVKEIDYDIYKSIFEECCMEEPELALKTQKTLLKIVGKYAKIKG